MSRPVPPRAASDDIPYVTLLAATLLFGLLLFYQEVASVPPWPRLWAWAFLHEYSGWARLGIAVLPLLATVALHGLASPMADVRLTRVPHGRALAIVAAGAFVLFWAFREERHWGDSHATIQILDSGATPFGPFYWKEPLDRLIAVLFTALGRRLLG